MLSSLCFSGERLSDCFFISMTLLIKYTIIPFLICKITVNAHRIRIQINYVNITYYNKKGENKQSPPANNKENHTHNRSFIYINIIYYLWRHRYRSAAYSSVYILFCCTHGILTHWTFNKKTEKVLLIVITTRCCQWRLMSLYLYHHRRRLNTTMWISFISY